MKRCMDVIASSVALILLAPVLGIFCFLVWRQDQHSPFYRGKRVGLNAKPFKMLKLRSMVVDADKTGVASTSSADSRITAIGHIIRRYKLDELCQFWNVLCGEMSLVGPRPQVEQETLTYSSEERGLLLVKPGITDFASIVFADEGDILNAQPDPEAAYQKLIRPWKSQLALFYVDNQSLGLDCYLCYLTALNVISRRRALNQSSRLLARLHAPQKLIQLARREALSVLEFAN